MLNCSVSAKFIAGLERQGGKRYLISHFEARAAYLMQPLSDCTLKFNVEADNRRNIKCCISNHLLEHFTVVLPILYIWHKIPQIPTTGLRARALARSSALSGVMITRWQGHNIRRHAVIGASRGSSRGHRWISSWPPITRLSFLAGNLESSFGTVPQLLTSATEHLLLIATDFMDPIIWIKQLVSAGPHYRIYTTSNNYAIIHSLC